MNQTIECVRDKKFIREFKSMSKICRTLSDDFVMFEKALTTYIKKYGRVPIEEYSQIKGLGNKFKCKAFVAKKFYCDQMKKKGWNSGFRITFIYCPFDSTIHYIEIFFKGRKTKEDKGRITKKCFDLEENFK